MLIRAPSFLRRASPLPLAQTSWTAGDEMDRPRPRSFERYFRRPLIIERLYAHGVQRCVSCSTESTSHAGGDDRLTGGQPRQKPKHQPNILRQKTILTTSRRRRSRCCLWCTHSNLKTRWTRRAGHWNLAAAHGKRGGDFGFARSRPDERWRARAQNGRAHMVVQCSNTILP